MSSSEGSLGPLVLASTSPQRRAILEQLRIPFLVVPPRYVEEEDAGPTPVAIARRHAQAKARSVLGLTATRPVLGVDTLVVCQGRVLGKASGEEEARAMLRLLSGRWHRVVSALCLVGAGDEVVAHAESRVLFRPLSLREMAAYVASGEWVGRAGGYAIQGLGASLVERIDGDYLTVVGLPGSLLVRLLAERFPRLCNPAPKAMSGVRPRTWP